MLKSLLKLFNERHSIDVPRDELATIVAPMVTARFMTPQKDWTNKDIAEGWAQTQDWLRIGFSVETEDAKGTSYEKLTYALRLISHQIESASLGKDTIRLNKRDLEVLCDTYYQLYSAALYLDLNEKEKKKKPPIALLPQGETMDGTIRLPYSMNVTTPKGTVYYDMVIDLNGQMPFYNRPEMNHAGMAADIRLVQSRMEAFFNKHKEIRPKPDIDPKSYIKYSFD